jgi:methionyl aminopeptidase
MLVKSWAAIEKMKIAGRALACIMNEIASYVIAGVDTASLDALIEEKMISAGLKPECKGYAGYKHATCISLGQVIVHGVPSKEVILKNGDFVKIDVVGSYKGYCADITRYFFIGDVSPQIKRMAAVIQQALDAAIEKAVAGNRISDVSACIQCVIESAGFTPVRAFAGHGIGKALHEAPEIPNYGKPGQGIILQPGMTLAIEPMMVEKSYEVSIAEDGWTARTADGGLAAHVEDTVLITRDGVEILTRV